MRDLTLIRGGGRRTGTLAAGALRAAGQGRGAGERVSTNCLREYSPDTVNTISSVGTFFTG